MSNSRAQKIAKIDGNDVGQQRNKNSFKATSPIQFTSKKPIAQKSQNISTSERIYKRNSNNNIKGGKKTKKQRSKQKYRTKAKKASTRKR
jgi:hypothetical protein